MDWGCHAFTWLLGGLGWNLASALCRLMETESVSCGSKYFPIGHSFFKSVFKKLQSEYFLQNVMKSLLHYFLFLVV